MNLGLGLGRLIRKTPLLWHLPNQTSRMAIIQSAIDALGAARYLEIGVYDGECFGAIRAPEKLAVDPLAPQPKVVAELSKAGVSYHQMTSDEFFDTAAAAALPKGVDVVFIDGLHTDAQAYRDCVSALRYLSPGGVVLMHDNLPMTPMQAVPADSYGDARRLNGPDWDGQWTGDGWKAIVRLRALHDDVDACVLDCDHGVGVVWRAKPRRVLALTGGEIDAMTFADLLSDPQRLLGVRPAAAIDGILTDLRRERRRA